MLVNQATEDGSLTTVNQEAEYDVADDADGQHTPDGAAEDETEQKTLLEFCIGFVYTRNGKK